MAGVTPGKGGQKFEGQVPIFNTVAEAVAPTRGPTLSVIYVPPMARRPAPSSRRSMPGSRSSSASPRAFR